MLQRTKRDGKYRSGIANRANIFLLTRKTRQRWPLICAILAAINVLMNREDNSCEPCCLEFIYSVLAGLNNAGDRFLC